MDLSGFMNLSKQPKDEDEYLVPSGLAALNAPIDASQGPLSGLQQPAPIDLPYGGNPAFALSKGQGPLANTYMQSRFGMNLPEVRQRIRDAQDRLLSATAKAPQTTDPTMSAVAMMLANMGNVVAQSRGGGIAGGIGAGLGTAGVGMLALQRANAQNDEMMRQWQLEQAKQQYQNAIGEFGLNMQIAPEMEQALRGELTFGVNAAQRQATQQLAAAKAQQQAAQEQRLREAQELDKRRLGLEKTKFEYQINPPQKKFYKEISFFDNPWQGNPEADEIIFKLDSENTGQLKKSLYDEALHNTNQLEPVLERALTAAEKAQKSGALGPNVLENKFSSFMNLAGGTPEISDLQAATKQLSLLLKPSATGSLSDSDRKTLEEAIGSDKPLSTVINILSSLKSHVKDPENMLNDLEKYRSVHGYTSGFLQSRSAYKNYQSAFTDQSQSKPLSYEGFLKNLSQLKKAEPAGVNNVVFGRRDPNIIQYTDDEGIVRIVDLRKLRQ